MSEGDLGSNWLLLPSEENLARERKDSDPLRQHSPVNLVPVVQMVWNRQNIVPRCVAQIRSSTKHLVFLTQDTYRCVHRHSTSSASEYALPLKHDPRAFAYMDR